MQIVGLTGAIGHGKSSLAEALQIVQPRSISLESGSLVAEVANSWLKQLKQPLDPKSASSLNGGLKLLIPIIKTDLDFEASFEALKLSQSQIDTAPADVVKLLDYWRQTRDAWPAEPITALNKEQHRPLLQWLGGYLVQNLNAGIWYNRLVKRAQQAEVPLAIIGGLRFVNDAKIIHQAGGTVIQIVRPQVSEADLTDPTERQRKQMAVDGTVINNASLEQLQRLAKQLYSDLQTEHLQTTYRANDY
jgi:hypothetical protein